MTALSRAAVMSGAINASRVALLRPIKIRQVGEDVFLRGFVDWVCG